MGEKRVSRLWGAIIGFLAAFGSIGALATGMRLEGISFWSLALAAGTAAVIFSLCSLVRGFSLAPIALAVGCWLLWRYGSLSHSTEALVYQLSLLYHKGYGWPILRWTDIPITSGDAQAALGWLSAWVALAVSGAVGRNRSTWLGVIAAFLPLVPCMLLTDTVPKPSFLYFQFVSILLMLLPQLVRSRDLHQGNALIRFLALPTALGLGLLFWLMPQSGYTGFDTAQRLSSWFEETFLTEENESQNNNATNPQQSNGTQVSSGRVNLTSVGPKRYWEIPVMEVTAQETGLLYLRGTVYDEYRGTYWNVDEDDSQQSAVDPASPEYTVKITTLTPHKVLYMPYVALSVTAGGTQEAVIGRMENPRELLSYSVTYRKPYTGDPASVLSGFSSGTPGTVIRIEEDFYIERIPSRVPDKYLQLSASTRERAARFLQALEQNSQWQTADPLQRALLLCDYVSRSATYDLETEKMPVNEDDFALWFLESSETGYCTHFASATAVLLRCAGIPARYVTGYLVRALDSQTVTVMQRSAHAWVECYIEGMGWTVLEPTPGSGIAYTAGNDATQPSEPETETTETTAEATVEETTGETTEETAGHDLTRPTKPTDTTRPNSTEPPESSGSDQKEAFRLPGWLGTAALVLALLSLIPLQWRFRVWLRRQPQLRGQPNDRALACWRALRLYSRLLKQEPDPVLYALALKARFSQHRITKEELQAMNTGLRTARGAVRQAGLLTRLIATLILALH